MIKNIVVFGMGYVGIPCAALLADVPGHNVIGIQRRSKRSGWKIAHLNAGKSPFEGNEPGLDELIAKVVKKGTFKVTDDPSVTKNAEIILIDVQTPTDPQGVPYYDSLREVSETIGKNLKKDALVVVESTVAPGTTQNVVQSLIEKNSGLKGGKDFSLAFSYERVMPGRLLEFIINMPRVVGGIDQRSTERATALYKTIVKKEIVSTSCLAAETAKTIENAYRDVNIAFANEMALVCESLGVNVYEIRDVINMRDDRHMHIPGAGVGGHCLPKDSWLLRHGLSQYGNWKVEPEFIALARRINDQMPIHMANLTENALSEKEVEISKAKIVILGIAYLENSDDTRNTPAIPLIKVLKFKGATVIAHDPFVQKRDFDIVTLTDDFEDAVTDAHCVVIVTKHQQYYHIDLSDLKGKMKVPIIIDGRNVFSKDDCTKAGFYYRGVGKGVFSK
jgi:UDP-N-acetyl-D-mannosaminuronic acid dehydrogenase